MEYGQPEFTQTAGMRQAPYEQYRIDRFADRCTHNSCGSERAKLTKISDAKPRVLVSSATYVGGPQDRRAAEAGDLTRNHLPRILHTAIKEVCHAASFGVTGPFGQAEKL